MSRRPTCTSLTDRNDVMPPTKAPPPRSGDKSQGSDFESLKRRIHTKLVDKLDLTRVGELEGDVLRREIRLVVEHLCDTEDHLLNRSERDRLVEEVPAWPTAAASTRSFRRWPSMAPPSPSAALAVTRSSSKTSSTSRPSHQKW